MARKFLLILIALQVALLGGCSQVATPTVSQSPLTFPEQSSSDGNQIQISKQPQHISIPAASLATTNNSSVVNYAEISGQVTIVNALCSNFINGTKLSTQYTQQAPSARVYWVIDISVKNISYERPVNATAEQDRSIPLPTGIFNWSFWSLMNGDQLYADSGDRTFFPPPPMSVTKGATGHTTVYFSMGSDLNPTNLQIRYGGQEPFSYGKLTLKGTASAFDWDNMKSSTLPISISSTQPLETYVVSMLWSGTKMMKLLTVASWNGSDNKVYDFNLTKSPAVINFGYTPTSRIASSFVLSCQGGNIFPPIGDPIWASILDNGTTLEGTGKYKIKVTASGCNWWIKIGVEP